MAPKKKGKKKGTEKPKSGVIVQSTEKTRYWVRTPPAMISAYENKRWHEVQRDVMELTEEEALTFAVNKRGEPIPPKIMTNRQQTFEFIADRYVKYTTIAKQLDEIYNYMVHPQKRSLVRTVLTDVLARILELKEQMVLVDERDFHFLDDMIQDYRLTPRDLELNVPTFFMEEQYTVLKNRELLLKSILARCEDKISSSSASSKFQNKRMSFDVLLAVLKIQRNHRGYMGRRNYDMKARTLAVMRHKEHVMYILRKYVDKWVCFMHHKQYLISKIEDMQFLGMLAQPDNDYVSKLNEHYLRNKEKAKFNQERLEEDKILTEEEIINKEGYDIAWALKYNITQWLLETKNLTGKFPVFPPEEKGGSKLLFSNKSLAEVQMDLEAFMDKKSKDKKGKKGKKRKEKGKKKKEKKAKGKKKKKKGKDNAEDFEWSMPDSKVLPELNEARETYKKFWFYNDDAENYSQTYDRELMKEDIRLKVAETIRTQVDELMKFELENMQVAIERAKRNKAGKKKSKKGKKEGKKKKGKGKGKKGKKKKDLTSDRTIDDLYEELVQNDVIRKTKEVRLADFIGDYSYTGCITQNSGLNPLPSLADVRKLILEFAVLPLGSNEIHKIAPLNRSMLITGLRGTGKDMLVNAICTEVGANLFDVRVSNLIDKYGTKQGKKMIMHLLMKQVKNGDRMMLIGTSRRPHLCKNTLSKFFNKTVVVPYPDYGSRYETWKYFITKLSGLKNLDLDLTSLTKVTTGYTVEAIKAVCTDILTEERLEDVKTFKPLTSLEFVQKIASYDPIYRAEHQAFINWFEKTPKMKARLQRLGIGQGDGKKKDKKGKGKGKGGKKKKKK